MPLLINRFLITNLNDNLGLIIILEIMFYSCFTLLSSFHEAFHALQNAINSKIEIDISYYTDKYHFN